MNKRRRFTADFKARVALDALRGDRTIQEIAAQHKVHPNQVSTWKRQAMAGTTHRSMTVPASATARKSPVRRLSRKRRLSRCCARAKICVSMRMAIC